jgi:hypothetical protein
MFFENFFYKKISKYSSWTKKNISKFNLIRWTSKNENISSIKRATKCVKLLMDYPKFSRGLEIDKQKYILLHFS